MKGRYAVILLLIGGLLVLGSAFSWADDEQKAGEEKTGFWIESKTVDVGKVKAGSDAVGTFVFHNETDKPVKIIKAKPS